MGEIEELRRRLEALEAQVHDMAEQQAATRHLVPRQATFAPSRRPARTLAAPPESPSTSSTRTSGRHAESTHRTPLLDGQTLPAGALAVNSDRDAAALQEQRRADVQLLQALRQTQLEHTRTLEAHTRTLTEHGKLLGALVAGQVAIMEHLGINPPGQPRD